MRSVVDSESTDQISWQPSGFLLFWHIEWSNGLWFVWKISRCITSSDKTFVYIISFKKMNKMKKKYFWFCSPFGEYRLQKLRIQPVFCYFEIFLCSETNKWNIFEISKYVKKYNTSVIFLYINKRASGYILFIKQICHIFTSKSRNHRTHESKALIFEFDMKINLWL